MDDGSRRCTICLAGTGCSLTDAIPASSGHEPAPSHGKLGPSAGGTVDHGEGTSGAGDARGRSPAVLRACRPKEEMRQVLPGPGDLGTAQTSEYLTVGDPVMTSTVSTLSFQYALVRSKNEEVLEPLGFKIAFIPDRRGCIITRIHGGGIIAVRNGYLRRHLAKGMEDNTLSPGDVIRAINGDVAQADMKQHLSKSTTLHLLVNRAMTTVTPKATAPVGRVRSPLPPPAVPLPTRKIPPPAKASLTGPGSWPKSASDICRLFVTDTDVTIDLNHVSMISELRFYPERRVWFGLAIRRIMVNDRLLIANAHISLLCGTNTVVEQAPQIAQVFHIEISHWRRSFPDGMPCVLRHPTDHGTATFQSTRPDYAWLLVIPRNGRGLYDRLFQAVAYATKAHNGQKADIYPRGNFHISFDTNKNAPWDAAYPAE